MIEFDITRQEKSTLYSYAIISQPIHAEHKYSWQRVGKYKKIIDAEKAIADFTKDKVANLIYRIVPYFDGYWWTDAETLKNSFSETNGLLWDFLKTKELYDEALDFVKNKRKNKKFIFF